MLSLTLGMRFQDKDFRNWGFWVRVSSYFVGSVVPAEHAGFRHVVFFRFA